MPFIICDGLYHLLFVMNYATYYLWRIIPFIIYGELYHLLFAINYASYYLW